MSAIYLHAVRYANQLLMVAFGVAWFLKISGAENGQFCFNMNLYLERIGLGQ